ncbi:MAG: DegV family protein [Candidatus Dormibacteraeota bacterium]|nr:DegV family protein [Candidatus Dormibacteraeota bacterium]
MSRRFRVVTDSTSDVPPAWRERFGIEVVPLTVVFGNESFRDRVDLSHDEFFSRLRGASKLPTTSAPAPGDFATVYERLSRECDGVISIHLGGNLSGTVDSARLGAQAVDGFPVHVVDSRSVTMCVGFLCRLAAESTSLEEAVQRVEERVPRLRILALLDTLRYLEMGGRVTHAQALVGTVLDVKPIMGVAEGRISPLDRVRTRRKALPRLVELFRQDQPVEQVAVMHAEAPEEAEQLRAQLAEGLPENVEIEMSQIGPVLATHTGPGAVGLAYIKAG